MHTFFVLTVKNGQMLRGSAIVNFADSVIIAVCYDLLKKMIFRGL
jgi:hypothetical protein